MAPPCAVFPNATLEISPGQNTVFSKFKLRISFKDPDVHRVVLVRRRQDLTRAAIIAYMNHQAQVAPAAETVMRLSYALSCPRSDGDASDDHHLGRNLSS
jgi:hypothetical protein